MSSTPPGSENGERPRASADMILVAVIIAVAVGIGTVLALHLLTGGSPTCTTPQGLSEPCARR